MNDGEESERRVVYCLVPPDLADRLHDLLRDHFREEPAIEVVVERRRHERRSGRDRREGETEAPGGAERRLIRSAAGRRMGERRAALVPVEEAPALPRRARRHAERLAFVERVEPTTEQAEDLDSARLVARVQAGDDEAFSTLYTRYFDRVYGYLRVAFKDPHEAEDATQQVFTLILERIAGYERRGQPFRAWMFTIARHQAINQLRKLGRLEPEDPAELDRRREGSAAGADETGLGLDWISNPDLLLFVERLPAPQRQVLAMRYMLDLKVSEIAAILGRTPNDVSKLQHRALAFLRKRLTAIGRGPERRERPINSRHRPKQAEVLRERRFALFS